MTKQHWVWVWVGIWVGVGLYGVGRQLVYNPSTSLPQGWYVKAWPQGELTVGDLVVVESPDTWKPYVPAQFKTTRLLKQVAAGGETVVCWAEIGMYVTHASRLHTTNGLWRHDQAQQPQWYFVHPEVRAPRHPIGCQVLAKEELVVTGGHTRSIDSRYLGPVDRRLVQYRVVPLWTWEFAPLMRGGVD